MDTRFSYLSTEITVPKKIVWKLQQMLEAIQISTIFLLLYWRWQFQFWTYSLYCRKYVRSFVESCFQTTASHCRECIINNSREVFKYTAAEDMFVAPVFNLGSLLPAWNFMHASLGHTWGQSPLPFSYYTRMQAPWKSVEINSDEDEISAGGKSVSQTLLCVLFVSSKLEHLSNLLLFMYVFKYLF